MKKLIITISLIIFSFIGEAQFVQKLINVGDAYFTTQVFSYKIAIFDSVKSDFVWTGEREMNTIIQIGGGLIFIDGGCKGEYKIEGQAKIIKDWEQDAIDYKCKDEQGVTCIVTAIYCKRTKTSSLSIVYSDTIFMYNVQN